ncbi:DUF2357 domain-containing protein [Pseudomonas sp. MWU12-2345]|uniref:DUF2357 domain-containing protein n=1 Tax=Pseudomonas sp. MWU12-2345 TaxID=2928689 RepID=UPI00200CA771|nr:DUF2357 domain-containing protein [Pseudomonas sp. MWU12-2345]
MMRLHCRTASDAAPFELVPGALSAGFTEQGEYFIQTLPDTELYIDDVRLETVLYSGYRAWHWLVGYYAGEVAAELVDASGSQMVTYRLDVSPHASKLGGDIFAGMVQDIADFDPQLLYGSEQAQSTIGTEGALSNPHLQYARLRRYCTRILSAYSQVLRKPLTNLRRERQPVSAHQIKRLDVTSIRKALASPNGVALLHPDATIRPALNAVRLDVATAYESLDNPANQALGLVLHETLRRCNKVIHYFTELADKEKISSTRSPLAPRLTRRIQFLSQLRQRLERLTNAPLFRQLSRRRLSAAGLNAISAHPDYARAYRFTWYALRTGLQGQATAESLWISPTWEIYERWCYVKILEQLRLRYSQLSWTRHTPSQKTDRLYWRGRDEHQVIEVWLQARCPAVDQPCREGFSSLSRERSPDIVITQTRQQQPTRFIVLDAKYRTSRSNVLDAMGSAHLYHDSLRWNGCKPDASLLLIPRADQVRMLQEPAFHTEHGVGVIELGNENDALALVDRLQHWIEARH